MASASSVKKVFGLVIAPSDLDGWAICRLRQRNNQVRQRQKSPATFVSEAIRALILIDVVQKRPSRRTSTSNCKKSVD